MSRTEEISVLLAGARQGDADAERRLFDIVYDDLRRIARLHLRGRGAHTLGTTAVVNEAYLRLAGRGVSWNDRLHFMAVASRAMRSVLVDHARAKLAAKRGGKVGPLSVEVARLGETPRILEVLELEDALVRLGALNERLVRVVELRFFGGLVPREIAAVLDVGERTVERDWYKARSFLHLQLREAKSPEGGTS